jgi:ATP-dependent protease ClpP protease subunit
MSDLEIFQNQIYHSKTYFTYLFDEVNYTSCQKVIADIDKANLDENINEILLTICSGGGNLLPAFALFEHIQNSKKDVNILVDSWCGSAAFMILQAGKNRYATKLSRFKIHSSSHTVKNPIYFDEFEDYGAFQKESHLQFIELTTWRTKITYDKFKEMFPLTKYISAIEAKNLGFIDHIIYLNNNSMYQFPERL